MKCEYGCGNEANYKLKNGKLCCKKHQSSCPAIKQKIGNSVKGKMVGENHPFYGKTHTNDNKEKQSIKSKGNKFSEYTYESFLKKYPFFPEYEEIRKNKNNRIEVRCRECNKWFEPLIYHKVISYRAAAIKNPGSGHAYMFCSVKCKEKSSDFYSKKDPKYLTEFDNYKKEVLKYTYMNLKNHKDKIEKACEKTNGDNLDLDHKFSMSSGFKHNINPKAIGNWRNLEFINMHENRRKGSNCSITLKEILIVEKLILE